MNKYIFIDSISVHANKSAHDNIMHMYKNNIYVDKYKCVCVCVCVNTSITCSLFTIEAICFETKKLIDTG